MNRREEDRWEHQCWRLAVGWLALAAVLLTMFYPGALPLYFTIPYSAAGLFFFAWFVGAVKRKLRGR